MNPNHICSDCGGVLTDEERHYYEFHCEACEQAWHAHIQDYRLGRVADPELDRLFSARPATTH